MKLDPKWVWNSRDKFRIEPQSDPWNGLADLVIKHVKSSGSLESAALMLLDRGVSIDEAIHICSKYLSDICTKGFN